MCKQLNALDSDGPLALQPSLVALLLLLLAVLETGACVRLEHAVLATEVTAAESAVSDDALSGVLAVFELAAHLLWRAAADWQGEVQHRLAGDVVVGERGGCVGQVLAGEDDAQLVLWDVGAERHELRERADGGGLWYGDCEGCYRVSRKPLYTVLVQMLTIAGDVLNEDLHGLLGRGGGAAGAHGGDG